MLRWIYKHHSSFVLNREEVPRSGFEQNLGEVMKIIMPLELLTQAGLTPTQAEILGFLLAQNELKAKEVVAALDKPRGVVYKGLEELADLGLVEKIEKMGSVTRFRAEHPSRLETLFEAKEKAAQKERQAFVQNLPELTSYYNLSHCKPGMNFYEGEAGLKETLEDMLRSRTEILMFIDQATLENGKTFANVSKEYKDKQVKAGIKQRIIIAGDGLLPEQNQSETYDSLTEIRYTGNSLTPFKTSVKIYDNKIAYQAFDDKQTISVVVADRNIYEMNKAWFEFLWQHLK